MKKNQALIDELNKELEAELEKEPAQMDTEKIREINKIIARLGGRQSFRKKKKNQNSLKNLIVNTVTVLKRKKSIQLHFPVENCNS